MEYKQLIYDIHGAFLSGETRHPQVVMNELGYKILDATPQSLGDCWWFTVEEIVEPLSSYLRKMDNGYNFDYWHNGCYRTCEYFKNDPCCCQGGYYCLKKEKK